MDECILFRRQRWGQVKHAAELWQFLRDLSRRDFDLVLDLQGLFRSGLCTKFARAPRKIGFASAREGAPFFYTEKVQVPDDLQHAVEKNLLLAETALGETCQYEAPDIAFSATCQEETAAIRDTHGFAAEFPILAVAPCSRWESKTWPPEFFAETLSMIHEGLAGKLTIWLLGTKAERSVGEAIAGAMNAPVVNLMGVTSLPVTMNLLRQSQLLITHDSGPMHIAAALSVPTVSLFGPTDPIKTGPYGDGHRIFQSRVSCAPCFLRTCPLPIQICRTDIISPQRISEYSIHRLSHHDQPLTETKQ